MVGPSDNSKLATTPGGQAAGGWIPPRSGGSLEELRELETELTGIDEELDAEEVDDDFDDDDCLDELEER
jgi:hypothetical protein